jgi:hypothetical protein
MNEAASSVEPEVKTRFIYSKCNFGVNIVNCGCFLDISIYSFSYVAASNQQTPVFKA